MINSFLFNIKIPSFPYFPYLNDKNDKNNKNDQKKINIHPSLTKPNQPIFWKPLTVSKEMSDYIKKNTESSIQKNIKQFNNRKICFNRQIENVYPRKDDNKNFDKYDLIIHKELKDLIDSYKKKNSFSLELFYEIGNELYQNINYYSYLGLFTGVFFIILRREKVELFKWFSKR